MREPLGYHYDGPEEGPSDEILDVVHRHPVEIVATPAPESRRPIILVKDEPMTLGELQAVASGIRATTSYPVIVMGSHWTVYP